MAGRGFLAGWGSVGEVQKKFDNGEEPKTQNPAWTA